MSTPAERPRLPPRWRAVARTIVPLLLLAPRLHAQEVQLAPFVGLQFGGRVYSPAFDSTFSLRESLDYGATLDVELDEQWRLELLYSRQSTELRSDTVPAPGFRQIVERYMVGIQEEFPSDTPVRFFGVGLVGATRLVPGASGADSELRFAVGLSLGAKILASRRLAFRFEARGFYTVVESGGRLYCVDGACLFQFTGSGIWQGDVAGGLAFRF